MVTFKGVNISDKGFLINLKSRKDRLEESLNELDRIELNGIDIFEAIENENPIYGCSKSHYEIFVKQVQNKWEKVIILEDDFLFDIMSKTISEIDSEWINNVLNSDFDVLFLGSTHKEKALKINDYLHQPKSFVQATVYVVNLKAANFIVENYKFWDNKHIFYGDAIDSFFNYLIKKTHWRDDRKDILGLKELKENNINIYFSNPIIFNQRPSYSNLQKRNVNYFYSNRMNNLKST